MKKIINYLVFILLLIIPFKVNAENFKMENATMECMYENGYSIIYDGKKIYLSDAGSQSANANSSISVTNKYLLGGTDWLKSTVFEFSGTTFKCPSTIYEAQLLNGGSTDESKSYSKYFFAADSRPNKATQYEYLKNFTIQVMKDNGWVTNNHFNSRPTSQGDWTYNDCGSSNDDTQKNCTIKLLMNSNETFKNTLQLEDVIGAGYASNIGDTTHTVTSGWWIFSSTSTETAPNFYGYSAIANETDGPTSSEWSTMSQLQRFIEKKTSISGQSELIREKIFVEESKTPKFTCNYMSEATQAISSKSYITYEKYDNGMILVSGNFGTTSGDGISDTTLKGATKYADCPNSIYVKSPYSVINYDQENPTQSFNAIRYLIQSGRGTDYVKMNKLADGTYICKKVGNKYYDDEGNEVSQGEYNSSCNPGVDVCNEYLPKTTVWLKQIISWLTFLVPIFIAILIMIDFVKCIIANSNEFEDKHKRKLKHIKTRIFILILFLLLRPLINMVLMLLFNNGIIEVSNIDCLFF